MSRKVMVHSDNHRQHASPYFHSKIKNKSVIKDYLTATLSVGLHDVGWSP